MVYIFPHIISVTYNTHEIKLYFLLQESKNSLWAWHKYFIYYFNISINN